MSLVYFFDWFPEESELESLVISLDRQQASQFDLPAGQFLLTEQICSNPECRCDEVIVTVTGSSFTGLLGGYAIKFVGGQGRISVEQLDDPPVSKFTARVGRLLTARMNADARFSERLKRHYELIKSRASRDEARRRFLSAARVEAVR